MVCAKKRNETEQTHLALASARALDGGSTFESSLGRRRGGGLSELLSLSLAGWLACCSVVYYLFACAPPLHVVDDGDGNEGGGGEDLVLPFLHNH